MRAVKARKQWDGQNKNELHEKIWQAVKLLTKFISALEIAKMNCLNSNIGTVHSACQEFFKWSTYVSIEKTRLPGNE